MYQPAFRTGYEGRSQCPGKKFEEVETNLQRDYEKSRGNSTLSWDKARSANARCQEPSRDGPAG